MGLAPEIVQQRSSSDEREVKEEADVVSRKCTRRVLA
jgi:hypothetical protein